ncbi:hypothetical protein NUACC21_73430 [Scytonema sp. NUACC21]
MQSQSNDRHAQLAQSLHRIVEILRTQQGSTWRDLVQTVSGKTAVIDLDGIQLLLRASGGEQLQVESEYPVAVASVNFRTEAETLRDMIAGRLTLDTAIAQQRIDLRGSLEDLLGFYRVALSVLADSAINPQLRRVWTQFDQSWSRPSAPPLCLALEQQRPSYGVLTRQVPEDVLGIEINLPQSDSTEEED